MYLVRHGKYFYLQSTTTRASINWGDRLTARLYASEPEALCVIDALLKTGNYSGYNLTAEQFQPAFTDVPLELLVRLRACAQKLVAPPNCEIWKQFWKTAGWQAANAAHGCLVGAINPPMSSAIEIDTGLLEDLQECASKLAISHTVEPSAESIAAVAAFAQKTLLLSEPYIESWVGEH